jgi:hypothetical protein
MSDCTFVTEIVKTRKPHRCVVCWWPVPVGEECTHWTCVFNGEFQNNYAHKECAADLDGEEFGQGDGEPPERIRTMYPAPRPASD